MSSILRFDTPNRLRVAVAGRANSGKTTLIRTLLRSPAGDVADRANVTSWPDYYADDELGVILIDCPGFQDAGGYRAFRMTRESNPALANDFRNGTDFSYEDRAMDAVSVSGLVLYVASLETVPEASHNQELRLLRDEARVIGLLNKRRLAIRALGEAGARDRVRLWAQKFSDLNIPWAEYDVHVAPPKALSAVHELIMAHLSADQAEHMRAFVRGREHRATTQREKVAAEFARRVVEFRGTKVTVTVSRECYSPQKGEQAGMEALRNAVGERLVGFVAHCAEVYGYRPQFEQLPLSIAANITQSLMEGSVGGAVFFAAMGAQGGAMLGMLIAGTAGTLAGFLVGGPAGAWIGFDLGTTWGIGLGAATGAVGMGKVGLTGDKEATVHIAVDQHVLGAFGELATAWAAALAYQNFGKGEEVGADSMQELRGEVGAALKSSPINLELASEDDIQQWMRHVLEALQI